MTRSLPRSKVVRVDLDEPLRPVPVESEYGRLTCVVIRSGDVLGMVSVPALEVVPADVIRAAIVRLLPDAVWRAELEQMFFAAVGARAVPESRPAVSVVVCTRDRIEDLRRCLTSLAALDPAPLEVIVVDSAPSREDASRLCAEFDVTYLHEPVIGQSRARNRGIAAARGEVVAFTDDDCVVDPGWLRALAVELIDPRVAAVTGVVVPLELETDAQWLFEEHGGHGRGYRRIVLDGATVDPITRVGAIGVGANAVFRRSALLKAGPFAEWLGPGTPARAADDYDMFCRLLDLGERIVFTPSQLVWHRHRQDMVTLRRTLRDYGLSSSALVAQRVRDRRDLGALRVMRWWWLDHIPGDLAKVVRRAPDRLPISMIGAELLGTLEGARALTRSRRSREGVEPISIEPGPVLSRDAVRVESVRELPRLSVVVPTLGRGASLRRLLETLARQSVPADRVEVVVVVDGGEAEDWAGSPLPYRLVVEPIPRSGVAIARNRGVDRATGDVVVFLDDDVVPDADCLAIHALAHAEGAADIVLGYAPPVVGVDWWSVVLRAWWEDHFRRKADRSLPLRWSDVVTLNSSFARKTLRELGGFDPTYARRHEDWELGIRAVEQGLKLAYDSRAIAAHHLDTSLEGAVHRARDEGRADVLLARSYPAVTLELPLASQLGRAPADLCAQSAELEKAATYERSGRRRAWRSVTNGLFHGSYVAGVRDEIPDESAYREFTAQIAATRPTRVLLQLDGSSAPTVPAIGAVEFDVRIGDERAGVIPAGPAGMPWDWESVFVELLRHRWGSGREAAVHARLGAFAAVGVS